MTRNDIARAFAAIALEAGRAVLAIREKSCEAHAKADGSPVTEADLAAEKIILQGLADDFPEFPVVSEESDLPRGLDPSHPFILVDPLDGTREFVAGRPEFTVNIAMVSGRLPVAGAVFAPALGELYLGGEEAFFASLLAGGSELHSLTPIHVRTPQGAPVLALSRSHLDLETKGFVEKLCAAGRIDIGSSLKFGLIARGLADLYPRFSDTMEWDTAAGHAILSAAGGKVTTPQGQPFLYGKTREGFRNGPFLAQGGAASPILGSVSDRPG